MSQFGSVNPEERIALLLKKLKDRVDNMPLTRFQREDLDEIIGMIAGNTQQIVNERKLALTRPPSPNPNFNPEESRVEEEEKTEEKEGEE